MNKDDFLDLMGIPRWRLRNSTVSAVADDWSELPVLIQQAAELPQFISIVEANRLNAIEIELANAIAKACGIAQENHLILLHSSSDQKAEYTLQNFLVKSAAPGFIVFFGDKLSENINRKMQLPGNNGNWWTVATTTLTQLAQQPGMKKQLWQSLQLGMNK